MPSDQSSESTTQPKKDQTRRQDKQKATIKFKNAYSPSADDPGLTCSEILTEQHHAENCDVNKIVADYTRTGISPQNTMEPLYGDFSSYGDFMDTQQKLLQAEESFMTLDPKIRQRFNNSPAELFEFIHQPQNLPEAIHLGLVSKPITPVNNNLAQPGSEASKSTT